MRVIKSEKISSKTVFTVLDAGRLRQVERKDLPDESYQQWRREQAAECMRRKRHGDATKQVDQPRTGPTDATSSSHNHQETQTEGLSPKKPVEQPAKKATCDSKVQTDHVDNPLACKVCYSNQASRVLFPCTHLVTCSQCLTRIMRGSKRCPYCRQTILDYFETIIV